MALEPRLVDLSKSMSWLLRHGAGQAGIRMDKDGSVAVNEMLQLRQFKRFSKEDVLMVVQNNNKKRFGIRDEGADLRIWAVQGHSHGVASNIDDESIYERLSSPPEACVHGTFLKALEAIRTEGLNRMSRHHIHLEERKLLGPDGAAGSAAPATAKVSVSGTRDNCQALVHVDVAAAMADGCAFYRAKNGVILTEGFDGVLPPKYFSRITDREGNPL